MLSARDLQQRRKRRVRTSLRERAGDRPRLSVFRSNKHIYAQVIDDRQGHTLAQASTVDRQLRDALTKSSDTDAAAEVGKAVGARAVQAGVTKVVFDRGGYLYHGRVKALAEAARESGLQF